MRNLAKSLHTITSLTNVARWVASSTKSTPTPAEAVEQAAWMLGLSGMPDVYGLKDKAAAQLKRQIETNDTEELSTPDARSVMAQWKAEGKIKDASFEADWMRMVEMTVCRNSFGNEWPATRNEIIERDAKKLEAA